MPGWITLVGAALIISGALIAAIGPKEKPVAKVDARAEGATPTLKPNITVEEIRQILADELREQLDMAVAHMRDSYWTDSHTGHNIGRDELDAVHAMECISLDPAPEEVEKPEVYARRLLLELDIVAERFRTTAPDPDGYGIATIGTVKRNLERRVFSSN